MPFEKGHSGNLKGRTKGSQNLVTKKIRECITLFLEDKFERIETDFELLSPRDRIKVYCDLLHYSLPKLQTVQLENDFERLTDTELNIIISELKENTND